MSMGFGVVVPQCTAASVEEVKSMPERRRRSAGRQGVGRDTQQFRAEELRQADCRERKEVETNWLRNKRPPSRFTAHAEARAYGVLWRDPLASLGTSSGTLWET